MGLSPSDYDGFYGRFLTPRKVDGSMMMGADDIVGNDYHIDLRVEDGNPVAWLVNKFDAERAFLDPEASRRVQLALARGLKVRAVFSFLAYSDQPEPGEYWGEMAVVAFNPAYSLEMDAFVNRVAAKLAEGIRPALDLKPASLQRILENSDWLPSERIPLPKKKQGFAVLKDHQSLSEKMVESGRARNKGCYLVSYLFIALLAAGLLWLAKGLLGF